MISGKYFLNTAKASLILIYLVIIAGAVVRMTGSGMGCPDWPKCFGYFIPPTEASQLEWQPEKQFKEGQVIIREKALQVAKNNFTTSDTYNQKYWQPYTTHKYATFNSSRTWIEYVNRLVTVVLGIPMLLMLFFSIGWFKKKRMVTIVSCITVIVLLLQAVLGKLVVDTNLKPTMISVHMILALGIMLLVIYLIHSTSEQSKKIKYNKKLTSLLMIATIITFVQIFMGIQVRQFIDAQINLLGEHSKSLWLQDPTLSFYLHRSFSILVVLFNVYIAYQIFSKEYGYSKINWVLLLILLEVVTGMSMYYFDFPFSTQPLHLVLASLLLGVQFYLVLEALKSKRSLKTL